MRSGNILQNYGGEDVIILGEVHTENTHNELEEEAVYRTIPRYVLSEGLNDAEPEEFDEMIDDVNLIKTAMVRFRPNMFAGFKIFHVSVYLRETQNSHLNIIPADSIRPGRSLRLYT